MLAFTSLGRSLAGRALRHWQRAAERADRTPIDALEVQRGEAAALQAALSDFQHRAQARLVDPRKGGDRMDLPGGTDWSWRPEAWKGPIAHRGAASVEQRTPMGEGLTLFHDGGTSEVSLRQMRNLHARDQAPFGLRLEVFHFDGTFLSLVLDLPQDACEGLQQRHIVRVALKLELERRAEVFARLNVKHGPNTEKMLREIPDPNGEVVVEFDLAYTDMNEKRVESAWVDLIFEGASMNQITLRDITLCRYPRAEI
ncbi:hypothetical protein EU805_12360 [Salipiger sp. IMCC34102]|uniref:DUF6478 family protein n=1 Tax=Salipiger sp. IMCC34102 TaxID=2510647 RepID=UPI00101D9390|nr:DUF6478 family protein [Salipiger sp. IMCC34102]RYH01972.1 hypothetical protein EU805_12360 [Salipiger sp. IMCC34102]